MYAEVSALPFTCHSPIHCNVTLFSFCSPSHSTWFMLISSPHPCHTSCCSGSSPQSQPSVISHGQVFLLLPASSPALGSLPGQSQVFPNLDPYARHPHLTSSAPENWSLPSNSNPYPLGCAFTHSPLFLCPDPVILLPLCPLSISQSRSAGSCCPEGS